MCEMHALVHRQERQVEQAHQVEPEKDDDDADDPRNPYSVVCECLPEGACGRAGRDEHERESDHEHESVRKGFEPDVSGSRLRRYCHCWLSFRLVHTGLRIRISIRLPSISTRISASAGTACPTLSALYWCTSSCRARAA